MATQAEAINFLKSNFKLEQVSEDFFKILIEFNGNRSQLLYCGVYEFAMVISSPFATEDDLSPKQALNAVAESLFGVKLIGGHYQLSALLFMEDLDASEINKGLFTLAKEADDLEKSLVGGDRL